jgi:hypothetical protein
MAPSAKKVANNILDFLIDPTVVPVEERVYFRPEEILRNESYMKAKAEAVEAYKDQKHNSDFYPQRNRSLINREATIMDRKTLIASMDILSKNFKNPEDPIAHDLQIMARALSKMSDEELTPRLASDAPDMEAVLAAKTFKCPQCGTKVLEQTGYCVKCKKKVKKAEDENAAEEEGKEEKEAAIPMQPGQTSPQQIGQRWDRLVTPFLRVPGGIKSIYNDLTPKAKKEVDDYAVFEKLEKAKPGEVQTYAIFDKLTPQTQKELQEGFQKRMASMEFYWTKEASEVVARSLVAEVVGVVADDDEDEDDQGGEKEETTEAPAEAPAEEAPKAEEAPAPKKEEPVEAGKIKGPGKPDGTGPMSETPACPMTKKEDVKAAEEEKKEEPKEAVTEKATSTVNTDVLASLNFAGIEMEAATMDEVGEMSEQEKANLAKLF